MIPGASDLDFHRDLEEAAFTAIDVLRPDIALAIQADLAHINPAPFRYIDGGAETGRLPEGHIGPIPGAYHLMAGRLRGAEATAAEMQAHARWSLARLDPLSTFVSEGLMQHGAGCGQLALIVRFARRSGQHSIRSAVCARRMRYGYGNSRSWQSLCSFPR
ncbi:MAG: hypothetical protein R2867_20720 [Caldilineaceae bacterium]